MSEVPLPNTIMDFAKDVLHIYTTLGLTSFLWNRLLLRIRTMPYALD